MYLYITTTVLLRTDWVQVDISLQANDWFKLTKISKISFIGNSTFCDTVNLTTTLTVKSQTYVNPWFDISGVSCEK